MTARKRRSGGSRITQTGVRADVPRAGSARPRSCPRKTEMSLCAGEQDGLGRLHARRCHRAYTYASSIHPWPKWTRTGRISALKAGSATITATAHPGHRAVDSAGEDYAPSTRLSVAHRGASGYRTENTIAAFATRRRRADMVELDVRKTSDGKIILYHDAMCSSPKRSGRLGPDLQADQGSQAPRLYAGGGASIPSNHRYGRHDRNQACRL